VRALVTGAGRGLGAALVGQLADRGIDVVGTVRGDAPAEIAARCERLVRLDLSDRSSIDAAIADLSAAGDPIDLLVNNAGLDGRSLGGGEDDRGPLDIDPDVFLGQIEVNTLGPLLFTRGLIDLLRSAPAPKVVNVSSQLGHNEVALRGGRDAGYNASKAALTTLTASFARVLPGITFIAVHPGWVQTDMGGPTATLTVEDSARTLTDTMLGLTPDQSGAFLDVDGSPFTP
jgi:NAD(P)-dependent dehydrogenase (short-subunit alcohol dehydrogenase family)